MRLFVAVWPPDEVVEELRSLPRKDRRGVRFVHPHNWHITVRFLGEADPAAVGEALDGLAVPPLHVGLGPGVDIFADRVLVIPASGLDGIAGDIAARTRDLGEPVPRRRFIGHLTLARLRGVGRIDDIIGSSVSTGFALERITLVRSRLEPSGARYEIIDEWPAG